MDIENDEPNPPIFSTLRLIHGLAKQISFVLYRYFVNQNLNLELFYDFLS